MKKSILFFAALPLFWSCNQSPADSPEQARPERTTTTASLEPFVALDRAYIPPLFFTSAENPEAARASFAGLQQAWPQFQAASAGLFSDPQWNADLEKMDQHLQKAEVVIAGGKNLKKAHDELEHLREILLEARRRNGVDYFVDYLTDFHEPMEMIVLTAKQTPPEQWTEGTTAQIRENFPQAEKRWQAARSAAFQPADYHFDDRRQQTMRQRISAETEALEQLRQALDGQAPVAKLRAAALAIKPNFAELFKLFGDLEKFQQMKGNEREASAL